MEASQVNILFIFVGLILFLTALLIIIFLYNNKNKAEKNLDELKSEICDLNRKNELLAEEINLSKEGYVTLFNFVTDAIYIQDPEGKFVDVNSGAEKMYGYSREEFIGKTPEFLSAPGLNNLQETIECVKKAMEGEPQRFEFWGLRKNGDVFPKDVVLNKGIYRNQNVIIAISREITDRKKNETRITQINECFLNFGVNHNDNIQQLVRLASELFKSDVSLYNCIIDGKLKSISKWNAPKDFVGIDEPDGHICYDVIKNASGRIVNITDLSGTKYFETDPDVKKYNLKTYLGVAVKTDEKVNGSLCILFKQITSFNDDDLKLFSIIASAISIEEQRREAESKLKKTSSDLKELNIMKDKFFSIISHDLKNPFNAILGFASILSEEYDSLSDDEKKDFIKNIKQSSSSAYKLMDNLLLWTRSQTNRLNYNPEIIDMCLIALESIEHLKPFASAKNVKLMTNVPLNTVIYADKNMVLTIIRNLITNGIKFSYPGSQVTLSAIRNQNSVKLIVKDNGIGMNQETVEKLFKIDTMFKTEGTDGEIGTGLGLILCKEFVEKSGGIISVESELGEGTMVNITLPKYNQDEQDKN